MNPVELIIRKRGGGELTHAELRDFVGGYLSGDIPEYQMSAMLMAIFFAGMTPDEVVTLTGVYIDSGARIAFPGDWMTVDKHSTGGVGDKLSLMLAPLAAACGCRVPMISGRGLGHTGGTLDKLESIPGFSTAFSVEDFKRLVDEVGCPIVAQSEKMVPADKRIYALRDVTGTVESLPLITASIMSKKIAEGAQGLVIDLKVGSGAFMKDIDTARKLADLLIRAGEAHGQRVEVVFSAMNAPLGEWVGNALEVREAIAFLRGDARTPDQFDLTRELWKRMLHLAGQGDQATDDHFEQLLGGAGAEAFQRMIAAQGGDPRVVDNPDLLPSCDIEIPILAPRDGWIAAVNSQAVGYALIGVGAGRRKLGDALDFGAGAWLPRKLGNEVRSGELIGKVFCSNRAQGEEAARRIIEAHTIGDEPVAVSGIVLETRFRDES